MQIRSVKFILWVQDMDRAVAFWRDGIGLEPALVTPYWSELKWKDATIALHDGGTGDYRATGLGIEVEDVDAACAEVAAAGGQIRKHPVDRSGEGIRLADLVDTEGNGFQLSARIR